MPESCRFRATREYLCEPSRAEEIRDAFLSGAWKPRDAEAVLLSRLGASAEAPAPSRKPYAMVQGGLAVVPVVGVMGKGPSKLTETDTVETRRRVRAAAADADVRGIMLYVDSPGGEAAGTAELAADVAAAGKRKPVHAYIEDLGASAAYWVASQADRVAQNGTALVGSIGTIAGLVDDSEQAKMEGLKIHFVTAAPKKTVGAWGQPVTEEDLAYVRGLLAPIDAAFHAAVRTGRGMTEKQLERVIDGSVHRGQAAVDLRLTDGIETWDEAMQALERAASGRAARHNARAWLAAQDGS